MALTDTSVLPHLERFEWCDNVIFDKSIFEAITCSRIQHLLLRHVSVDQEFTLDKIPGSCGWRLKSLYLDVRWTFGGGLGKETGRTSPLIAQLLALAAQTLESLVWSCFPNPLDNTALLTDCADGVPSFPKLNDLHISFTMPYDPAWLEVLIQPGNRSPIRHLDMDIASSPRVTDFFKTCGTLPRLETFVWKTYYKEELDCSFLRANPRLCKLMLDGSVPAHLLEEEVLPTLSQSFDNLVSLSLTWESDDISRKALTQISTLRGLEQLCLSAGNQFGPRYTWIADHDVILDCCRGLQRVRKLAFRRDTYQLEPYHLLEHPDPQRYYGQRIPRDLVNMMDDPEWFLQEMDPVTATEKSWEMQHLGDMVRIAEKYATALPHLDWVYLGELPMQIKRGPDGHLKVIPLSQERDSCWTLLRRMFGRSNDTSL